MKIYDIAVVGGGPAGCMAAIRASQLGKKVILLERNEKIGHKLLLTANGRCNLTTTASIKVFMEKFG
jgi:predicted flavoprotein YhiN